jgi:preprotein translocase subunit SecE
MSDQVQEQGANAHVETFKLVAAVALVLAGIAAFYLLRAQPDWLRWLAVAAGLALAALVFAASRQGRGFWQFVLDSRIELRKVVWPNRQETGMTTAVVFGFVIIAGIFFWGLDLFLAWATKLLTGQGG